MSDRDWEALSEVDAELASWPRGSLFYPEVQRMRITWRMDDGTPARAEEALQLIDPLIIFGGTLSDLLLRAEASAAAGRVDYAWATLERFAQRLSAGGRQPVLIRRALALSRLLPDREGSSGIRFALERYARSTS